METRYARVGLAMMVVGVIASTIISNTVEGDQKTWFFSVLIGSMIGTALWWFAMCWQDKKFWFVVILIFGAVIGAFIVGLSSTEYESYSTTYKDYNAQWVGYGIAVVFYLLSAMVETAFPGSHTFDPDEDETEDQEEQATA